MSPPGTSTAPSPLEARQGARPPHSPALTTQALVAEARKVMDAMDVHVSANRLQRIIRRYLRSGQPADDFRTWFLTYADPTGEAAVRNVMRYY